jgi:hypothetical protein
MLTFLVERAWTMEDRMLTIKFWELKYYMLWTMEDRMLVIKFWELKYYMLKKDIIEDKNLS